VTYEMAMLADQVGPQLTPQHRAQLNGDQQSNSNS
jgi:hypothetical protein